MERRAQFLLVAFFLLLSVGALVWFMRWISPVAGEAMEHRLAQFEGSVSGLSVGSEVRYLGVPVGRVTAISLNRERAGRVDVEIGLDETLPDSARLIALLEPQGITGLSLVELRDRDAGSQPIDVASGVIPGQPSVFSKVSEAAMLTVEQTNETLSRISALLNEETLVNIEATALEMRTLIGNLTQASSEVDTLLASLSRVSRQVEGTLPAYNALALRLEGDLIPTVSATGQSLQKTSDALADLLGENRANVNRALEQDLPTLVELGNEFALTLQELRRLMASINNEPGALLYGSRVTETEIPSD